MLVSALGGDHSTALPVVRALSRVLGGRVSILEIIVVQTTGSAGESIAAGVAFTLPALVLLGFEMLYKAIWGKF